MKTVASLLIAVLFVSCARNGQETPSAAGTDPGPPPVWRTQGRDIPDALTDFLRANSDYRLLRAEDLQGNGDLTEGFQTHGPFEMGDANGDKYPDIAAVLVKGVTPRLYIVVLLTQPTANYSVQPIWVIRDAAERIGGVRVRPGEIQPLYCSGCDSNPVLRWVGAGFEGNVLRHGALACLSKGTKIYRKPASDSDLVLTLEKTAYMAALAKVWRQI